MCDSEGVKDSLYTALKNVVRKGIESKKEKNRLAHLEVKETLMSSSSVVVQCRRLSLK